MHRTSSVRLARPVTPSGIIADKLQQLRNHAQADASLAPEFLQLLDEAAELALGLDAYVGSVTTPQSAELAALILGTQQEDWQSRFTQGETSLPLEQEMLSGHLEGQFLKMLVHATGARRVLEIGLFTGYSALAMAEALPDDGLLVACEIDAFAADFARRQFALSPHGGKIQVEIAPASDTLDALIAAGERFDFVFIDADKGSYTLYLDKLLAGDLLAPNALICVDNTLMQGQPYVAGGMTANGRAIAAFNMAVAADKRIQQVLLPIRDGVTLIRRV